MCIRDRSWGVNHLDVFAKGGDGHLYRKWLNGEDWGPGRFDYEYHDGIFVGMPSVVCKASDRLDIVPMGTDGNMYVQSWNGYQWVPSQFAYSILAAPVRMSGPPAAASWGADRVDVFAMGTDGRIYDAVWAGWW